MQPLPVKKGTPFLHCLAGASVWYAAFVVVLVIIGVKFEFKFWNLVSALLVGAALFGITSAVTWLILLKARIKPWVLIFVTLPVYPVVWIVLSWLVSAVMIVLFHLRG